MDQEFVSRLVNVVLLASVPWSIIMILALVISSFINRWKNRHEKD